jgi:hypothetical protein
VVDMPPLLQGVRAAAACEGGHAPEFRRSGRELKPLDIVGLCYLGALWRCAGRDWSRITIRTKRNLTAIEGGIGGR